MFPLLLVSVTPRDQRNNVEDSLIRVLIIFTTKKGLYVFATAVITDAIIYLEIYLVKEVEER